MKLKIFCFLIASGTSQQLFAITLHPSIADFLTTIIYPLYFIASFIIPATQTELLQAKKEIFKKLESHHERLQENARNNTNLFFNKCNEEIECLNKKIIECGRQQQKTLTSFQKKRLLIRSQLQTEHKKKMEYTKRIFHSHHIKLAHLAQHFVKNTITTYEQNFNNLKEHCLGVTAVLDATEERLQKNYEALAQKLQNNIEKYQELENEKAQLNEKAIAIIEHYKKLTINNHSSAFSGQAIAVFNNNVKEKGL